MESGYFLLILLACVQRDVVFAKTKCRQDQYACLDGIQCIPKEAFCDQTFECRDRSDEIIFDPGFHIPIDGIACRSWYSRTEMCLLPAGNGYSPDDYCNTGSDCPEGFFKCSDGNLCIPKTLFCDGQDSCGDGSDELMYKRGRYSADDGVKCRSWMDLSMFCLLPASLRDRELEICNTESTCAPFHFMCDSGDTCIHARDFCSGMSECEDGSDEVQYKRSNRKRGVNCRSCLLSKKFSQSYNEICLIDCDEASFMCTDGTQCIDRTTFCDGEQDCGDGSDEMRYKPSIKDGTKCQSWTTLGKHCLLPSKPMQVAEVICNTESECLAGYYQCDNGNCIEGDKFCNGDADCSDGSDEVYYNGTTFKVGDGFPCVKENYAPRVCILGMKNKKAKNSFCDVIVCNPAEAMSCANGIECVPAGLICNGIPDCSDSSDEIPFKKGGYGERCRSWSELKQSCLLPSTTLSGADNSAQRLCRPKGDSNCGELQFKCLDGSRCIEWQRFCNGIPDCDDGSDEAMAHTVEDGRACRGKFFDRVCHLPPQYPLELFCFDLGRDCDEHSFVCADETQCFPKKAFCNGIQDCRDGSDEVLFNPKKHKGKGSRCRGWAELDRVCLLPTARKQSRDIICNGKSECLPLDYKCSNGKRCIFRLDFCSGEAECKDNSDEIVYDPDNYTPADGLPCANPLSGFVCLLPSKFDQDASELCAQPGCAPEQFRCSDGQCIQRDWFCNESEECSDGSDEIEYNDATHSPADGLKCDGFNPSPKSCLLPPGHDPLALCVQEPGE